MISLKENSELIIWLEDGVLIRVESGVNENGGVHRRFSRDFNLQARGRMTLESTKLETKLMQERVNWKLRVNWTYRIIGKNNFNAHWNWTETTNNALIGFVKYSTHPYSRMKLIAEAGEMKDIQRIPLGCSLLV